MTILPFLAKRGTSTASTGYFKKRLICVLLGAYLFPIAVSLAVVSLTIQGQVDVVPEGITSFSVGDSLTLSFTFRDFLPDELNGSGDSTAYNWFEMGELDIFEDVSFTHAAGAWAPPSSELYNSIDLSNTIGEDTYLSVLSGINTGSTLLTGLSLDGIPFVGATGQFFIDGATWAMPGSPMDPNAYFSSHAGSYAVTPIDIYPSWLVLEPTDDAYLYLEFIPQSLTISVIPEPAAGWIIGGVVLALALIRRRKRLSHTLPWSL